MSPSSGEGTGFTNFQNTLSQRPLAMNLRITSTRQVASYLNDLRVRDRESIDYQAAVSYLIEPHKARDYDLHWLCDEVLYSRNGTLESICNNGKIDLLRTLLEAGVSPNVSRLTGYQPPIFCAISQRDTKMLGASQKHKFVDSDIFLMFKISPARSPARAAVGAVRGSPRETHT
jgi:hypothetical protein